MPFNKKNLVTLKMDWSKLLLQVNKKLKTFIIINLEGVDNTEDNLKLKEISLLDLSEYFAKTKYLL